MGWPRVGCASGEVECDASGSSKDGGALPKGFVLDALLLLQRSVWDPLLLDITAVELYISFERRPSRKKEEVRER
jgi:hypothetical protein